MKHQIILILHNESFRVYTTPLSTSEGLMVVTIPLSMIEGLLAIRFVFAFFISFSNMAGRNVPYAIIYSSKKTRQYY